MYIFIISGYNTYMIKIYLVFRLDTHKYLDIPSYAMSSCRSTSNLLVVDMGKPSSQRHSASLNIAHLPLLEDPQCTDWTFSPKGRREALKSPS